MKKEITIILAFIFSTCLIFTGHSQTMVAQRKAAAEKSIPNVVLNTYKEQYPGALLKGWYVTHLIYWQNDYSSDWYSGWYGERSVVIYTYQKPNYFEVEFIYNPGELSRAIYNIYGYWYETRTQIKGLTRGIYDSLKVSQYNGWKISATMEKLESPMWPVEIYRFQVSKGIRAQILRMDANGNLIQAKELND